MFSKTKAAVNTFVEDRVTGPVRTALVISVAAFLIAGLALLTAIGSVSYAR